MSAMTSAWDRVPVVAGVRSRLNRLAEWIANPDVGINTPRWLGIALVVGLVSVFLREPILALIAFGIALVAIAVRIWWDNCFRGFTYERTVSATRAFHGDTVEVSLTATNAKPLPVARLEVADQVSINVEIPNRELSRSDQAQNRILRTLYSLGMYERVHYTFRVPCQSRGWHRFGPAVASASDPLGLSTRREELGGEIRFLVYPRMVPIT
ncbi:MAG TPA: hypothetical protein VD767_09450, partial [Thermomicrobiales bacterium]|nr:hypothetical protein [Thermomicrobiales bacterium]